MTRWNGKGLLVVFRATHLGFYISGSYCLWCWAMYRVGDLAAETYVGDVGQGYVGIGVGSVCQQM